MKYELNYNGMNVLLATPTRKILKEKDDVINQSSNYRNGAISFDNFLEKMYNCAISIIGEENLMKIIEHTSIDDIDVVQLEVLLLNIFEVYNSPKNIFLEVNNKEKIQKAFSSIPLEKIKILNEIKN